MIDCDNCIHNLVCNREQHLKERCIFFEEPRPNEKWIPEIGLNKTLDSFEKVFKDITAWIEVQMLQNRLMKLQICDLKDRVDKLEAKKREGDQK